MSCTDIIKHKVHIKHSRGVSSDKACLELIKKIVQRTLRCEKADTLCVINVLITNDKEIRTYNRKYRDKDIATDVLSFPMQEFTSAGWIGLTEPEPDIDTGYLPLGDIVISIESAKKQADLYDNSVEYETAYLIIHSTLHLIGYNHDNKENEKLMHGKTKEIIKETGLCINDK